MELRTLRSFLAVAREGNVTRAARTLHITQPALSRQLVELERELGCELLVRGARGVSLTDEGMLLRKRAEEIVSLADRAELEIRTPVAEVSGEVWVGGGESRAMAAVARAARQLSVEHPGLRLRMYSGNGPDVLERMEKGLLDFGVVMGDEPGGAYETLALGWQDGWGLLVRRDHPLAGRESLSLDDLVGERLVVSAQHASSTDANPVIDLFQSRGLTIAATYTLLYNASLLVEEGAGVAVCFDGIVPAGEGTSFAYIPLPELPRISSYLAWKRGQPLSRAARAFLDALRDACSEDAKG